MGGSATTIATLHVCLHICIISYSYRGILHFIMLHCTTVPRWFNCCWRMELTQTRLQKYASMHACTMHACTIIFCMFKILYLITQNGYSPLISAAKIGSKEIIQLLLQWSSSDGERIDVSKGGNVSLYIYQCMHAPCFFFYASTYSYSVYKTKFLQTLSYNYCYFLAYYSVLSFSYTLKR